MTINIPTWYVNQYSTNINLLVQQKGSRLRSAVMQGSHVGKQASPVDQIAAIAASKVTVRFGPMQRTDATLDRRWVFPVDYDLPQLIDEFDRLRLLTNPDSEFVTNAVYAMGRAMDDEILAAFTSTNKTGVDGSTSTSALAANVVGVNTGGTNSNINVAKLRLAKRTLMSYDVDLDNDTMYCAISAKEHDSLLNEIQIVSTDYNDKAVLVDGKVQRFLGINFIHTERVVAGTDDQAGTSNSIPVWVKSGMYLGTWKDISASISVRHDLQGEPWQAYCIGTFGATRREEKKIIQMWCH
jgi:hypothetical protein